MTQPDLQKIWGDLDWENADIPELHKQILDRQKQGIDINQKAQRLVLRDETVSRLEEYTLMDLVREKRQFTPPERLKHWDDVVRLMWGLGAKCACALQYPKTPAQKLLNELSSLKHREKILVQQLQKLRQRSQ